MTQRDIFYKWLFYALAGVLWAVLQQLILNRLDFWGGVHPFVLPLVPVMVAILEKRTDSAFFAVGAGLFCDLLLPGVIPCFYTLVFPLIALVASHISRSLLPAGLLCSLAVSAAAFLMTDLFRCFLLMLEGHRPRLAGERLERACDQSRHQGRLGR